MSIDFNNYYKQPRYLTVDELEDVLDVYIQRHRHDTMDLESEVTYLIKTAVTLQGEVFDLKQQLQQEREQREERKKKIGFDIEDDIEI